MQGRRRDVWFLVVMVGGLGIGYVRGSSGLGGPRSGLELSRPGKDGIVWAACVVLVLLLLASWRKKKWRPRD